MAREPARWRKRLAIGVLALPPALLWVLLFVGMAAEQGLNIEPVPSAANAVVLGWSVAALAACAWLAWRVSRGFLFALAGIAFFAFLGQMLLPSTFDRLNHLFAHGPATVRTSLVLAEGSNHSRGKYGWRTSHTALLADWRDPGQTIAYPGESPVGWGEIVCVDERRGLLGAAWVGGLHACESALQGRDAVAATEAGGLPLLALRETDRFEVSNAAAAMLDAGVPGQPFGLATWFDGHGEPRWLAGAVLLLGGGRAGGIYRGKGKEGKDGDGPACPLGLAALASDGVSVWSVHKSRDPVMDAAYPFEMTRVGNRFLRVWQRDDCKLLAEWSIDDWILDADVDLPRQRVAQLVVEPWKASAGVPWPEWVKTHAHVELRDLRGGRLWSQPLNNVRSPSNAKLQLTPDGLYVRDQRGTRPLADLRGGAPSSLPEQASAPARLGWFYDRIAGMHWVGDPDGLMAYAAFPDAMADRQADAAIAPRQSFRWPLGMLDMRWQVVAVSPQGGSVLVVHTGLAHALLLDTASGRWQLLAQDLRDAQASFSADGRSLAACVETGTDGRCMRLARPDDGAFFRP